MSIKNDLRGELIFSFGLGVFHIFSPSHMTLFTGELEPNENTDEPEPTLIIADEENNELLNLKNPEHMIDFIRLSLQAVSDQAHRYQSSDFEPVIARYLDDDDEVYKLTHGAVLMKNEIDLKIGGICSGLMSALDQGLDHFHSKFIEILKRQSEEQAQKFADEIPKERFLKNAITLCDASPVTSSDSTDDVPPKRSPSGGTFLHATWLEPIIYILWASELVKLADKTPKLQRNVNTMILELARTPPQFPDEIPSSIIEMKEDQIWLDFNGGITAGLTPEVVSLVLAQRDQAFVIDLLKLFTTLWNENPNVQRNKWWNIPGRWAGLVELLNARYGTSRGGDSTMKVINACRLLEALRWGTSWADHSKLLSFGGRKRNEQLIVTYMPGFWGQLTKHERLIPILNHPPGQTRSRALYNRFGLALGSWLVDNSHEYLTNDGTGVPLNSAAYKYFTQQVGFGRRADVDRALRAFENQGAISCENGLIGLGEKNLEGKRLILEGAKRSHRGRLSGLKSRRKYALSRPFSK